jgi:hypothetical protein
MLSGGHLFQDEMTNPNPLSHVFLQEETMNPHPLPHDLSGNGNVKVERDWLIARSMF